MDSEKLALLADLGRAFASRLDLDTLVPLINERTREAFDAESSAVLLLDEKTHELFFPFTDDIDPDVESQLRRVRFPADRGVAGWVLRSGKGVLIPDVSRDERFYPEVDRASGAQTRDLLYAPLRSGSGVIGVIGLRNKRSGRFAEDDLPLLEALAGSIGVAIENARLYEDARAAEERLRTEASALRRDLARRERFVEIVGTGPAMADVFRLMERAAAADLPVLIEGETGTGKELVARAIHRESPRSSGPFLPVNCAAISESLLESELFGHRRGAFTGAEQDRIGVFEAADGGTIFLDEVGEMPVAMQAKLLRVLEEGEVVPVGETRAKRVDVRVISATNRSLVAEVAAGRFREDLFYRLSTFPIRVPPLRERPEDVPVLADRIVRRAAEAARKKIRGISTAVVERLVASSWRGNVRELENELGRAVALAADGREIELRDLSEALREIEPRASVGEPVPADDAPLRERIDSFEADYVRRALALTEGNVSRAARMLGLSRVALHKKIKRYGIRE